MVETGNVVASLDHNHPLFLQPSDTPGLVLISLKLTGPENYVLWSRAMKLALRGKGKLGFVDENCVKITYIGELAEQWEKCDDIVLLWIGSTVSNELMPSIVYASKARKVWNDFRERFDRSDLTRIYHLWTTVATLRQGTDSITSYFSKIKDLWDELDVLVPISCCDCEESRPSIEYLRSQRVLQVLMELNETYSSIRSNVLAKRHVVTVNEAYAIVIQEESQRALGVFDAHKEPLTMLARNGPDFKGRSPGIFYEHCGYKGHLKENYFKVIGYPADFKSKRKNQTGGGKVYTNNVNVNHEENKTGGVQMQGNGQFFTDEQYMQLVQLLNKSTAPECSTNMTGIMSLLTNAGMCDFDWVIDTKETHHVTYTKDILNNLRKTIDQGRNDVQLPTGNKAQISHTWEASILGNKTVKNVLYVPYFKFNLLSVSKLTKDHSCSSTFFPDFYMFQDLYSGRVMGIGRQHNGLYLLKENITVAVAGFFGNKGAESGLWHLRLRHASLKSMQHIPELKNKIDMQVQESCNVCPLAK